MFFNPTPTTHEEARKAYHKLAMQHHPDHGGDLEAMKAINAEYARLLTDIEKGNQRTRQAEAHANGRKTCADFHDLDDVGDVLYQMILDLLNLDMQNVTVELVGLWIWVTGDTKPHKDKLGKNGLGLRWANKKKAWSFAGVPSFHTGKSLNDIRNTYGSTVFTKRQPQDSELIPATV